MRQFLIRADDTTLVPIRDDDGNIVDSWLAPDLKPPQNADVRFVKISDEVSLIQVNGESVVIDRFHTGGGGAVYYVVSMPARWQTRLENQLGASNVAPLIGAARSNATVRSWLKAAGFRPYRDSQGRIVGVYARHVISGCPSVDIGGDDPETAQEMADLE